MVFPNIIDLSIVVQRVEDFHSGLIPKNRSYHSGVLTFHLVYEIMDTLPWMAQKRPLLIVDSIEFSKLFHRIPKISLAPQNPIPSVKERLSL